MGLQYVRLGAYGLGCTRCVHAQNAGTVTPCCRLAITLNCFGSFCSSGCCFKMLLVWDILLLLLLLNVVAEELKFAPLIFNRSKMIAKRSCSLLLFWRLCSHCRWWGNEIYSVMGAKNLNQLHGMIHLKHIEWYKESKCQA